MYNIEFSKSAEKEFFKLERVIQERVVAVLERVSINPYPHIKKLVGNPYFRLRVGDYRVILDIRDQKFIILVIEVGHRKNIYNR